MHVYWNVTSETYPLSRIAVFIGINKANVPICLTKLLASAEAH